MTHLTTDPIDPARRHRRVRQWTVAGVVCAGLATGGAVAANAATSSGGSGSTTPPSSSSSKPAPPAHGPAAGGVDGTITAVSSSSLTVRNQFGTSKTYALTSSTTYHSGPGTKASASSLAVGQRVSVRPTTSGGTTAQDVDVHAAHIDGTVTAVSGDTVTVTDPDGFTRTIELQSGTTYTKDGASSSRSAVVTGAVLHAEGTVDSNGTSLDATTVNVLTKAPTPPAGGPKGGPHGGPGAGKGPGGAPGSSTKPSGTKPTGAKPTGTPPAAPTSSPTAGS